MSRPRYKRSPGEHAADDKEIPVVLPHVVMTVAEDGTMTVTIDGAPHLPEPFAPPWRRESFAQVLDQLTGQRRSPVRVEVREADGTVFTDIITPSRRRTVPKPPARAAVPALPVLYGEGFVPGEDVAVAVVIAHGDAAPDGTMRGLIEAAQLAASPTREMILLGRVSGALTIGHPE
ncbi:hypothetical protein SAMN05443377_11922 [Propionibacterium cyclohexanicum]|uniref:Uncharacterized protein n=1 Tax=Propionibacterium cyclohexanicum TaxID=64702 RepID=A0A1H9T6B1_9ACTN|nr:hypothetical protein [Propionibacterium cyclohexanicum]SER92752.1 hypothetical protein SAMN05443377_11922 [Propionibacterium cyclohexanicum]